jgi:PAS domain S-box-containing protein
LSVARPVRYSAASASGGPGMDRLHLLRNILDDANERLETMQRDWRDFDAILEALPAAIFVSDAEPPNEVVYVSPSVERLFGWSPEQVVADVTFWWRHMHPDDVERVRATMAAIARGATAEVEYRFAHPERGWRRVRTIGRFGERHEDGRGLIAGVSYDVSDHARAVAAPAPGATARAEFLAMLAHELRNPLNAMAGALEVLASTNGDPACRPWIEVLERGLDAALSLTGDTLDCGLLDAGQMRIEPGALDVAALLRDVEMLCGLAAERAGLALVVRAAPDMPDDLVADARRLRQVLINLVQNAVRFTPTGSVTVEARVGGGDAERTILELSVTDTGPGLDTGQRARLFQPFAQPPGEPAHGARGTGLGLTITHRLLAAMGGSIGVEPGPTGGTRFVARVPVRRGTDGAS